MAVLGLSDILTETAIDLRLPTSRFWYVAPPIPEEPLPVSRSP